MSKPPDSKPYELAVLRGAFSPEIAREVARKATSKLFSDPETLSMFRAFQKLHFSRTPVTRESMLLEMQTTAELPEENITALVDVVLDMPEPKPPRPRPAGCPPRRCSLGYGWGSRCPAASGSPPA